MNDPISKQAAIDALCNNCDNMRSVCAHYPCKQYIAVVKLPFEQPEAAIPKEWDEAYRIASNIRMGLGIFSARECWELVRKHEIQKVKHGRWVYKPNEYDGLTYECSICKEPWTLIDGTPEENNMHYCPNCGAKMEG